jgi:hypothetical protein
MSALALIYFGLIALAAILAIVVVFAIVIGRRNARAKLEQASHPAAELPHAKARRYGSAGKPRA